MIAQLVAWFLAFGAVFVFGMIWGLEVGSRRGWHRGRRALLKEQRKAAHEARYEQAGGQWEFEEPMTAKEIYVRSRQGLPIYPPRRVPVDAVLFEEAQELRVEEPKQDAPVVNVTVPDHTATTSHWAVSLNPAMAKATKPTIYDRPPFNRPLFDQEAAE